MEEYEYKVDSIQAAISEADLRKGAAGSKVASQVELKLRELSKQGYEYYSEFPVNVTIQRGCRGRKSDKDNEVQLIMMVFRRKIS